jgi:hypothetical protein
LVLTSGILVRRSSEQARRQHERVQSQTEAKHRCLERWQQLQPLLARFHEQRRLVQATEQEAYRSGAGEPRHLDPEEQRRLAPYDQEIEEEQYRQAVAAWQLQENQRRTAWIEAHRLRRDQRGRALDQAAASLRRLVPNLVDDAVPPDLNSEVLNGLQRCDVRP